MSIEIVNDITYINYADIIRKNGCQWLVNGAACKKECGPFIQYCEEHKDIPDIKRVIHEPITICRKRK